MRLRTIQQPKVKTSETKKPEPDLINLFDLLFNF